MILYRSGMFGKQPLVSRLTSPCRAASVEKVKRVQGSQIVDSSRIDGINQIDGQLFTDADRAIATVARKLSSELSVEYQVNE
jgi:hypothetical protein